MRQRMVRDGGYRQPRQGSPHEFVPGDHQLAITLPHSLLPDRPLREHPLSPSLPSHTTFRDPPRLMYQNVDANCLRGPSET